MISYKKIDGKHCVVDEQGKTIAVCPKKKYAMFFIETQADYFSALDEIMTPTLYYFECDLADSDDGYSRKQQGVVYAVDEESLFWAIDEILCPIDVRITSSFYFSNSFVIGWEHQEKGNTDDDLLDYDSRHIMDSEVNPIVISDDALWLKFEDYTKVLMPILD